MPTNPSLVSDFSRAPAVRDGSPRRWLLPLALAWLATAATGCGGVHEAHAHYAAGRYLHAIDAYTAVYAHHASDPLVNRRLGRAWYRLAAWDRAETHLRRALEAGDDALGTRWLLADCLARRGLYRDAAAIYAGVIERHPDHAPAWNNLGTMHLHLGEPARARAALERALALRPAYPAALVNLGLLHDRHLGDRQRAAELLRAYRRVAPRGERLAAAEAWLARLAPLDAPPSDPPTAPPGASPESSR